MRWLLFLSRITFICGVAFLIAVSLLFDNKLREDAFTSTVAILGQLVGLLLAPIVVFSYLIVFIVRKKVADVVPRWLIIANTLFFFLLIFYIFYLNDPYYNKA